MPGRYTGLACALLALGSLLARAQDRPATESTLRVEQPAANAVLGVAEVSVSCNNRDGVAFGSKFVVEHVPLVEGQNHLLVKATDTRGQGSEAALDLVWELTPPRVKVLGHNADQRQPNRATVPRGLAAPDSSQEGRKGSVSVGDNSLDSGG